MARCTAKDWKCQLPWVLLGLRAVPRANSDPSAAEEVYGEPFVVPGELSKGDHHNLTVQRLRDTVGKFAPCQRTYTDRMSPFTPPGLSSTAHVFVRNEAIRPPLTRLYRGPFCVLERNAKAFRLATHGKDWVSVDRLKPTLLEGTSTTPRSTLRSTVAPQPAQPKGSRVAAPGSIQAAPQTAAPAHTAPPT
ncbi:uncharacterized protein [Macrobrachium rosenbergii]|uniref:uncharacterized protein n=1 Tax=Macrobrachium rosenbergii TaxID=79674 RepID=UPI0034D5FBED